jgi:hypothetical protein
MKTRHVLCDLDHTIFDAFWRDPMIGGPGGWDAYYEASIHDKPLLDTIGLVNAMAACGHNIIGLTARPERWRGLSNQKLMIHSVRMTELLMRPNDCFLTSPEVKVLEAAKRFPDGVANNVSLVLDDREDVCAAFRGLGVTVHQVHARRS